MCLGVSCCDAGPNFISPDTRRRIPHGDIGHLQLRCSSQAPFVVSIKDISLRVRWVPGKLSLGGVTWVGEL